MKRRKRERITFSDRSVRMVSVSDRLERFILRHYCGLSAPQALARADNPAPREPVTNDAGATPVKPLLGFAAFLAVAAGLAGTGIPGTVIVPAGLVIFAAVIGFAARTIVPDGARNRALANSWATRPPATDEAEVSS